MSTKRLGIVVSGGPAPGINAVIGAATIEAINNGYEVFGFYDGLQWLCSDRFDASRHTLRLDIGTVARIHFDGGSILRISRAVLLNQDKLKTSTVVEPDPQKVDRVRSYLRVLGIDNLITIGGDDTALSARFLAEAAGGALRVVHVPKTIDNDLPLPHDNVTFGFSTARLIGTELIKNLMRDSQTTGRWYLATVMGRQAGWLAMGIGAAAGATLTLIPEEFGDDTKVAQIVDVLEGAILKRRVFGRPDGVALIAEGLAYKLGDRAELERLLGMEVPVDAAGHPRLSDLPLGDLLRKELTARFKARGESLTMVTQEVGYELRSADPTPFDMAYCRSLGYGCIRILRMPPEKTPPGVLVTMVHGNIVPLDLRDMVDPKTNRTRIRLVDTNSDFYEVARAYMIRLERSDLENPAVLTRLAAEARLSPEEFRQRFQRAATRLRDLPAAEQR